MDRYTYTLNQKNRKAEQLRYYTREELALMTTFQLRDICWKEQIVNGLQAPMDKDELIRQIMRFRGRKKDLFIRRQDADGVARIEELLGMTEIHSLPHQIKGCAKIVTYEGLAVTYFDHFTIGYQPEIAGTNALLVSGNRVCAIFQVQQYRGRTDCLYLTKAAKIRCVESPVKSYRLYCMDRAQSEWIYRLYETEYDTLPEHLSFYLVPVMDFKVRNLLDIDMPLAIDFGTTNTTAGTYLDSGYMERLSGDPVRESLHENDVNYVTYLQGEEEGEETPILPSVVAVTNIEGDTVHYAFGHRADRLFHMSYIDEGFCVFYDIKRWISDPEREEELVDKSGHRCFVRRKEIIRAFLEYVISCATQRFKCRFKSIHISAPVKQKKLFVRLFKDILPDYEIEEEDMLDEGVAVLYNSISDLIAENKYENNEARRALIIDCGGGTTDLSSCCFIINNQRVAYRIQIATAYENGDTDFGGNNLTFRIMEMLKISLARQLDGTDGPMPEEILEGMGEDIFRETDTCGVKGVYRLLDEEYAKAEAVIPTRFREYEHRSNAEYYAVKNNFYYLFGLAEQIKKAFYGKRETLRIAVSGVQIRETATRCLLADRFKLSVLEGNRFQVLKDIPTVYFSISALDKLLKADIYGIVKKFIGTSYESGDLQEYSIMRLTGQSCRIALFREALKEFIPGKIIESSRRERSGQRGYELKLMCLDGAVKYIRDRRFGYADVRIIHEHAAFPYAVTAYTHTGEEKVLIEGLDRENTGGFISRNMADLTLQLYLRDTDGAVRYQYYCAASPDTFLEAEAEQIVEKYPDGIRQDDVDAIVDRELRFFVLADEERWGFIVVPVLRSGEQLMLGEERFFLFETEGWLTNFFDGTK